jgi:DNA-binding MarR family transcriptional regulator
MEKADLVRRTADSSDRRTNIIKLTANGKKLLSKADQRYKKEISDAVAPLKSNQLKQLIKMLEEIRKKISEKISES